MFGDMSLNPYSNGTLSDMCIIAYYWCNRRLNPYSNGTLSDSSRHGRKGFVPVLILILMEDVLGAYYEVPRGFETWKS